MHPQMTVLVFREIVLVMKTICLLIFSFPQTLLSFSASTLWDT